MRISDWSSDVCSSDLHLVAGAVVLVPVGEVLQFRLLQRAGVALGGHIDPAGRSCSVRKRSGCVVITRVVNPEPYSAISVSMNCDHLGIAFTRVTVLRIIPVEIGSASCRERVCQYG